MNIPAWLSAALAAVALTLAIVNTVYARKTDNKKATDEKFTGHEARISKVEIHVGEIKGELKQIPSLKAVHKLELEMTALNEQLKPIAVSVQRIDNFLMNQHQPTPSARRTK